MKKSSFPKISFFFYKRPMYLAPRRERHVLPWHAAWQKIPRFNDYGEPIGAPSTSAVWVLQRSTAIPNNGFYRFHRVLQGQKNGFFFVMGGGPVTYIQIGLNRTFKVGPFKNKVLLLFEPSYLPLLRFGSIFWFLEFPDPPMKTPPKKNRFFTKKGA